MTDRDKERDGKREKETKKIDKEAKKIDKEGGEKKIRKKRKERISNLR